MVRPVWLEQSGSGTYLNPSKGAVAGNVTVTQGQVQLGPITLSGNLNGPATFLLNVSSSVGATVIIEWFNPATGWSEMARAMNQGQPVEYQIPIDSEMRVWRARYL